MAVFGYSYDEGRIHHFHNIFKMWVHGVAQKNHQIPVSPDEFLYILTRGLTIPSGILQIIGGIIHIVQREFVVYKSQGFNPGAAGISYLNVWTGFLVFSFVPSNSMDTFC